MEKKLVQQNEYPDNLAETKSHTTIQNGNKVHHQFSRTSGINKIRKQGKDALVGSLD